MHPIFLLIYPVNMWQYIGHNDSMTNAKHDPPCGQIESKLMTTLLNIFVMELSERAVTKQTDIRHLCNHDIGIL